MFFLLLFVVPAFAETAAFDESVLAEVQALQELKETQPDVYQKKIQGMRENLRNDIGTWRAQKPEVYQRFVKREQKRSQQHREFVQKKRPDLYPVYQKRQEQRKKKSEDRPTLQARGKSNQQFKPVRHSLENRQPQKDPEPPQDSYHPTRTFKQASRVEQIPQSSRQDNRIQKKDQPAKRFKPQTQNSTLHGIRDRPRNEAPRTKAISRRDRPERVTPRGSRQR